jgi:hypothetical protein
MHYLGKAQMPGVERDRGINIADDVPHAYRRHVIPPEETVTSTLPLHEMAMPTSPLSAHRVI